MKPQIPLERTGQDVEEGPGGAGILPAPSNSKTPDNLAPKQTGPQPKPTGSAL